MFTEKQKRLILIFFFSVLFSAVFVNLANPQNYMITEQELQSIEKISQTYEMEKQHWLEQAQSLNTKVETLNSQLKNQEVLQKKSEQLFNECEKEKLQIQMENSELKIQVEKKNTELQKKIKDLTIVICLAVIEGILIIAGVILTIKKLF